MHAMPFRLTVIVVTNTVAWKMRTGEKPGDEIRVLYTVARNACIEIFDHAELYSNEKRFCETRFSEALQLSATEREQATLSA